MNGVYVEHACRWSIRLQAMGYVVNLNVRGYELPRCLTNKVIVGILGTCLGITISSFSKGMLARSLWKVHDTNHLNSLYP